MLRTMTRTEVETWYADELCEAFAPEERKPLADIFKLADEGRYELLGAFEGGRMVGYATIWTAADVKLLLLDYLGVTKAERNRGRGARILGELKKHYAGRLIVAESELPVDGESEEVNDIRRRRIGFYIRNGFTPAYEMATCGLRWQALLSEARDETALPAVMAEHRALYGPSRTDVRVPIAPDETPELPYWAK